MERGEGGANWQSKNGNLPGFNYFRFKACESREQWRQNMSAAKFVPELIIALAGGHLSRRMYAVVGRSTAITDAADMA